MKRLLLSTFTIGFVLLCHENFGQVKDKMALPYKANYSSDFKMGNPRHSKIILELWKDFDENTFDKHNYLADTVVMFFADGSMVKGKDSVIAGAKKYRGSLAGVSSIVDAFIPLKSNDKNESWVAVWGIETDTYNDGKTEKKDLHEIWRINKDDKVDYMKQFASAHSVEQ